MPTRSVGLADNTLRSLIHVHPPAHASLGRILPLVDRLDEAGFESIEVWGEMPFEHALVVLNESPWDRLRTLANRAKKTPLRMVLRSTSLVGSRPYPADQCLEFVRQAADCGVTSFLIYDALNDIGNLEFMASAVRAVGAHLVLAVVAAGASEGLEATLQATKQVSDLGPDSLCLKAAGAFGPGSGPGLIAALREIVKAPLEVDIDNAGGNGPVVAALCAEAGADVIHVSTVPSWLDGSAVSARATLSAVVDLGLSPEVSAESLTAATVAFTALETAPPHRTDLAKLVAASSWDDLTVVPAALVDQVAVRLHQQGGLERLPEVIEEISVVRGYMGGPALVSPLAEIAATQAVLNVLYGRRWHVIPDEMKAYLRGAYGTPPAEPASDLMVRILTEATEAGGTTQELALTSGDAELALAPLRPSHEEILLELFAPGEGKAFLERRRAAQLPDGGISEKFTIQEDTSWDDEWEGLGPDRVRELIGLLESSNVDELTIENKGTRVSLRKSSGAPQAASPTLPEAGGPMAASASVTPETGEGVTVRASMVGTFYRGPSPEAPPYAEIGQHVEAGQVLCILEAMKLMNEVVAEQSGYVRAILVEDGSSVEYGQPLISLEPDLG